MMRRLPLLVGLLLPLLAGCSGGGSTSPSDEAALKAKLDKPMGSPSGAGPKAANPHAPQAGAKS